MKKTKHTAKKHKNSNSNRYPASVLVLSILGVALFGLVVVWVSVFGLSQYRDTSTYQAEPVAQYQQEGDQLATLELVPDSSSYVKNSKSSARVEIDTHGGRVDTVDVVLRFDKTKLRLDSVSYEGSVFGKPVLNNVNQDQGFAQLSAALTDSARTYTGKGLFARVYFTPLGTAESSIIFDCGHTHAYLSGTSKTAACNLLKGLVIGNISESGTTTTTTSGGTGGNEGQPHRADWCTKEFPERPTNLKAVSGPRAGTVKLTWTKSENTSHYTVTFGEKWMDFKYGSPNIGDTDQYLVTGLRPGVLYHFVLTAVNVCASSGYSDGASAYATRATAYTGTTTATAPRPTVKATAKASAKPLASPALETPPQATSSGLYDDWNTDEWNFTQNTATPEPVVTPTPTPTEGGMLLTLAKVLPWVGLAVLVILGIMLVKFIKSGGDEELPPLKQNFDASGEAANPQIEQIQQSQDVPDTQDTQGYKQPQDPLAPPFQ